MDSYIVVECSSVARLVDAVKSNMNDGYEPIGGIALKGNDEIGTTYYQAMVPTEEALAEAKVLLEKCKQAAFAMIVARQYLSVDIRTDETTPGTKYFTTDRVRHETIELAVKHQMGINHGKQ